VRGHRPWSSASAADRIRTSPQSSRGSVPMAWLPRRHTVAGVRVPRARQRRVLAAPRPSLDPPSRARGRRMIAMPARALTAVPIAPLPLERFHAVLNNDEHAELLKLASHVRQPAEVLERRPSRRRPQAGDRRQGRPHAGGGAWGRLSHRRPARRLGLDGRRALPSGRRRPHRHARRAVRRRLDARAPATSRGPARRHRDQRRRSRDPVRRRLRGGRSRGPRDAGRGRLPA
jgi:hypothetical protein